MIAAITPRREGYTSPGRETEVNDAEAGQRVDLRTALLALALVLWIAVHYGLIAWALRDLSRRSRVRGGNKATWALLILIVPVVGPLVYAVYGPTSFLSRPAPPRRRADDPPGAG